MAGEARVVREAELAPHPVDVHVLDALDGVVATGTHLVEAGRAGRGRVAGLVEAGQRPARAHRDVGELVLVEPRLAPVDLDDARAAVAVLRRHPVDPQMPGLDQVVVGGHQTGRGRKHHVS